jgi:hypothetical protein
MQNLKTPKSPSALQHFYFLILGLCRTWSLTLREEHRLGVFENRRRISGPKRDEVTGGCRKLHNEELHSLYSSPSIIRMIKSRRGMACSTNAEEEECM